MTELGGDFPGDASELTASARWHVHQVLPTGKAEVVAMTEAAYAASDFLDHRISVPHGARVATLDFARVPALFPNVSQLGTGYIFHISHVGSTLLAKALGTRPQVLSLREPLVLRWLAEIRRDLVEPESRYDPAGYAALLRAVLGLLGRPLEGRCEPVVKATSFASNLASDILQLQPNARAIVLFSHFEPFAANILRGRGAWSDMLTQAPQRLRRLHQTLDAAPWRLAQLSHGEMVAVSWLCEIVTLAQASRAHAGRMCWIDFGALTRSSVQVIGEAARFLGLPWGPVDRQRLVNTGVLSRYSKDERSPFDPAARRAELIAAGSRYADEITRGRKWLAAAFRDYPQLAIAAPFAERVLVEPA